MRKRIPVQVYKEAAQGILVLENLLSFPNIVYSAKKINTSRSQQQGKTHSCMEFRAYEKVTKSTMLHVELCTEMSYVAKEVLGLCAKDLILSESKHHGSCYKMCLRVLSNSNETFVDKDFNDIEGSG